MAQKKTKEFIATEMNLDMLDNIVSTLNSIADTI